MLTIYSVCDSDSTVLVTGKNDLEKHSAPRHLGSYNRFDQAVKVKEGTKIPRPRYVLLLNPKFIAKDSFINSSSIA